MNHAFSWSLALALVAGAACAACGGSSSSSPGGDAGSGADSGSSSGGEGGSNEDGGSVSASQACADRATSECARWDACTNGTYTTLHYGGPTACIAAVEQQCALGLAATGTGSSPAAVEACAQATPGESCQDLLGFNPPAACAPVAGPGANGTPCFAAAQCSSTYCAVPSYATCGTCAAVPVAGATCSTDADCGSRGGLVCNDLGACVALGAASAPCDKDDPCGPGLSCVGAMPKKSVKGTCQTAASTAGASCDANQQTAPGCDANQGLRCDAATSMCVADALVASGGTCGDLAGGVLGRCEANGDCILSAADAGGGGGGGDDAGADGGVSDGGGGGGDAGPATTGTCLAAAPIGSPCDTASGPLCELPGKCTSADGGTAGTCAIVNPTTCP